MSAECAKHCDSSVCIKLQNSSKMSKNMSYPELLALRYFNVQSGNGFSVDKDLKGYNPTREAYAVGGATDSVEMVDNDLLSYNNFEKIMKLNIEFMERQPDTTMQVIGAWVNDDNYAFIEVSDIVFDREEAIALGKERGEEAIWDFDNDDEIKLT
tara:strand:+ start:53 stop:517 length:465 start_codon:yes stop_codon:yes gene_type:complete